MAFVLLTLGLLVLLFLIMVALARTFEGHSVADLIDWKPTRSPEVEAQNEIDDVQQMIEAQNVLRQKRGAAPITEEDVQRQAREDQAIRARGRGPFAQEGGLDDEVDVPEPKPKRKSTKSRSTKSKSSNARPAKSTAARSRSGSRRRSSS
jgi:Na+-transporting methylmalonyl-CoA/oxaloacetate decarboxylase gamma subunit